MSELKKQSELGNMTIKSLLGLQETKTNLIFISLVLTLGLVISFLMNWKLGLIWLILMALSAWLLFRVYQTTHQVLRQYIGNLAYKINKGEEEAYLKMPIGMMLYNEEDQVQWINPYLYTYLQGQDILGTPLEKVDSTLYAHLKSQDKQAGPTTITWKGRQFEFVVHKEIRMIYLMDITKYAHIEHLYKEESPVIGQIFLDNFDEISQSLNDRRKSNLNNFVTNQLTSWANQNSIYLKRVSDDRFVAFLTRASLRRLEELKFDILDKVREMTAKQNHPLTLSMGFAYQESDQGPLQLREIAAIAQSNLDLALGRGGDQVVVKSKEENARFFGGKSNPMEKRTRVRSRMVSQALSDLIQEADQVLIMGHQYPDLDSIGSALGIRRIAAMQQKPAWIIADSLQYAKDIQRLMEEIQKVESIANTFISPQKALDLVTEKTLVIIVDVSRPVLTACPQLLEKDVKLVIIDHHRRGQDFPDNPVLVYIEPYASSTGELVTELFEYQNFNQQESILPIEATAILGGIIVDTRNFTLRTGSRTFDSASYLKSVGADSILLQRLMKENVETYLLRSQLLHQLVLLPNQIGIVYGEEDKTYPTVVAAQTADMMLSMENIDASFVVTKRGDGRVGISARSLGNKNVQRVMELMGGGGHLSNAATQLSDCSVEEAVVRLRETIQELGTDINL